MSRKYVVRLMDEKRGVCQDIIKKLKGSSQRYRRAQILLKADADRLGCTDAKIAEAFDCRVQTIENLRKRLMNEGFKLALDGKNCSEPPTPFKLMATQKQSSSPCDWVIHRRVTGTGHCNCLPTSWSPWKLWIRSATRGSAIL